jgi:fructoselysine 6-kinase
MNIASVGDIGVDWYTNIQLLKPGGIAFNFGSNATKLGACIVLVGAVGDDPYGAKLISLSKSLNFDVSHLQQLHGATAKQNIELRDGGERKFAGYDPGVLRQWALTDSDLACIAKSDAIFVPLSDGMEHIFHAVKDLNTRAQKIVDFSQDYEFSDFDRVDNVITKYVRYFDIIFIGGNENHVPLAKRVGEQYPNKIIVLTLGLKGSLGICGKKVFHQDAKIVPVIDTTGCGDAFQAAFCVHYYKSKDIRLSLKYASEHASHIVCHIGSTTNVL